MIAADFQLAEWEPMVHEPKWDDGCYLRRGKKLLFSLVDSRSDTWQVNNYPRPSVSPSLSLCLPQALYPIRWWRTGEFRPHTRARGYVGYVREEQNRLYSSTYIARDTEEQIVRSQVGVNGEIEYVCNQLARRDALSEDDKEQVAKLVLSLPRRGLYLCSQMQPARKKSCVRSAQSLPRAKDKPDFNRIRMRLPESLRFFSTKEEDNAGRPAGDSLHSRTVCPAVLTPFNSTTTSPGEI